MATMGPASIEEIVNNVQSFLDGRLSYEEFADWAEEYSWNIHLRAGKEVQDLAYAVEGQLTFYEVGDTDARGLRDALRNTIAPFVACT